MNLYNQNMIMSMTKRTFIKTDSKNFKSNMIAKRNLKNNSSINSSRSKNKS